MVVEHSLVQNLCMVPDMQPDLVHKLGKHHLFLEDMVEEHSLVRIQYMEPHKVLAEAYKDHQRQFRFLPDSGYHQYMKVVVELHS